MIMRLGVLGVERLEAGVMCEGAGIDYTCKDIAGQTPTFPPTPPKNKTLLAPQYPEA
jgi:hypothetical protein